MIQHHLIFRGLCSDIIKGQVAAVPIENSLSLLAQPRASKLLRRLRSHSLRSEAALKVFFGTCRTCPSLCMNRYNKMIQYLSLYDAIATNPTLRASLKRGG